MRFLLTAFLLVPLHARAGSFIEGKPAGEPVVRVVPGAKSIVPTSVDPLKFANMEAGKEVPYDNVLGVDSPAPALDGPAQIANLAPGAEAPYVQEPAAQVERPAGESRSDGVLPGLENMGERLAESGAPQDSSSDGVAQERTLALEYDKRADGGGAVHSPVTVKEAQAAHPADLAVPSREKGAPAAPPAPLWRRAIPNMLTTGNLWSGMAAAWYGGHGKIVPAVVAIIAANVFDMLDGRTARALKVKNPLGIDYDSLADMVSFGIAPAILIFQVALLPALGVFGFPIAVLFATAGWFRLSRFNVGAHAEETGLAPHKKSDSLTGLPIPGGAGVIAAAALALAAIPAAWVAPFAVGVTLLTAGAMASRLPYPAFKKGGVKALLLPAAVGLAAVVPLALLGLYTFIPAAVFGLYLVSGPYIWLRDGGSAAWKKELRRKRFHLVLLIPIVYAAALAGLSSS